MTDPSVPAVIEMVDVALRSYFLSPVSEPQLTNPDEVHEAIRGLKVSNAPGPNGIPNRALNIYPSERFPSSPIPSKRFSALITFPKRGITLECSLFLKRERIQHCPLPIGPLVFWTRLINYLKRSYYLGSYM